MSDFQDLLTNINEGMSGKTRTVSMGFSRLNKYISLRNRMYFLVFGSTGSGKSAFAHNTFILNPFDDYIRNRHNLGIDLKIILFTMERSKVYTQAKWLSRKIFLDHGKLIPIPKLMGWWDEKLTHDEHDYVLHYEDYFNELEQVLDIYEGARSPNDVYRILKGITEVRGTYTNISEHKQSYTPRNKELVICVFDHFGLTKIAKGFSSKKEVIDKTSEHFQYFRDICGYSIVGVSQVNRDLSNPIYQKMDSFEPTLDSIKESGRPSEDADCVISLFDPIRYNTNDRNYGDVTKFRDPASGAKNFRSIKILKNTYGEDDIGIGMAFHGATGNFKELPRASYIRDNWKDEDFNRVIKGDYYFET